MTAETDGLSAEPEPKRLLRLGIPSIVGSGLWALSAKLVSQAAQLAAFIIAAHVLTPTEFGFFAFSSAVAIFLVMVAEGGWAEFVMKSAEEEGRLDQLATIALASGFLITVFGLSVAGILHGAFDKSWEASLLALFCCWFLPAAMTTVYDGALVHRGQLDKQAVIRIAAEMVGLAVAVLGLWAGWNVFALVAGRLAMQLLILGGSILAVGWVRLARPTWPVIGEVLQFSRHIFANRMVIFLRSYSGTLAVGSFLGLAEAGYYRAAERIVAAFSELIGEPARMLAWIVFRRARDRLLPEKGDQDATQQAGSVLIPVLLAVAAPTYVGLALVSGSFVEIVLGEAWRPAALVVGILAAKQLLLVPSYVTEPLLSVRGTLRMLPPLSLFNAFVSVFLILVLAPFGLLAVALGQCLAAALAFVTSLWLQQRYGGVNWLRIASGSAIIPVAIAAMVAVVFYLGHAPWLSGLKPVSMFLLQVAAGASVYVAVLLLLWKATRAAMPVSMFERR